MNLRQYIGLPYRDKGRGPTGYDCWGLVQLIYREELGVEVPSYSGEYPDSNSGPDIEALIHQESAREWESVSSPAAGDVVLFRIKGRVMHCGVVIEHGDFIHVMRGIETSIERLNSITWQKRIAGFFRPVLRDGEDAPACAAGC